MELTDRFEKALVFAAQKHRGHLRKSTAIPYIAHLLQVAGLVLEFGGNEEEAIAALLHDTVEDGKATLDELRDAFGDSVAQIVEGCSDTTLEHGRKEPWWQRKRAYIDRLPTQPESVRLVCAADKLHNARAIVRDYRTTGEAVFTRFTADKAATIWYYHAVLDALRLSGTDPRLVDELSRAVTDLTALAYPVL